MVDSRYLGRIPFQAALAAQTEAWQAVREGGPGCLLGFESEPVVTLGVRAKDVDLEVSRAALAERGIALDRVDRGGQATLHNPGQLVIFPVIRVEDLGVRAWVCRLVTVTRRMAAGLGSELIWDDEQPGLYDSHGKVVSLGVRVREGVSTHGLAINVHNDLSPFSLIRACGRASAAMSRLSTELSLSQLFELWCEGFKDGVDNRCNLAEFKADFQDVRS